MCTRHSNLRKKPSGGFGVLQILIVAFAAFVSQSEAAVQVTTLGGGPQTVSGAASGYVNGANTNSQFSTPAANALDSVGNLYIADRNNHVIRKMADPTNPAGQTTTFLTLGGKSPVGIAINEANFMYVITLEDSLLRKYSFSNSSAALVNSNKFSAQPTAITLARDGSSMAYVTLSDGSIVSVSAGNQVTRLTATNLIKKPTGVAWMPSGRLVVSDTASNVIWSVDLAQAIPMSAVILAGQPNATGGFADASVTDSRFNQPAGVAAAGDGTILVADKMNNRVRAIAGGGVTTVYGIDSSNWVGQDGYFLGWLDSQFGTAEAKQPVSVTISPSGLVYVTELGYHLVRVAAGTGLSSLIPLPSTPFFAPSCGYYVTEVPIVISNSLGEVFYTLNGSDPTNTSPRLDMVNGLGIFYWLDTARDLSSFRVRSHYGTNWSATVAGQICQASTPSIFPNSGFYPRGTIVTVANAFGDVWYTTNGTEPVINGAKCFPLSMANGAASIPWTNSDFDLGYLWVKAFSGTNSSDPNTFSPTVRGIHLTPTVPLFSPPCGDMVPGQTITVSNLVGEVHYTTDGTEPTLSSTCLSMQKTASGWYVGSFPWPNQVQKSLSFLRVKSFVGRNDFSATAYGDAFCTPYTPQISPTCGYFPNGMDIMVIGENRPSVNVYYTSDGTEPTTNSSRVIMNSNLGVIHWTNALHDLSWLRVKAFSGDASSPTVRGESCPVSTPSFSPSCGFFTNCIDVVVTNASGDVHYEVDGSDPTFSSPVVPMTNGVGIIRWCNTALDLSMLRVKAFSGPDTASRTVGGGNCIPTTPVFSPASGYYPDGQTIWVTNDIGVVHFTTDGSEPTLDSPTAPRLANGLSAIRWMDSMHDLSFLRVKAYSGDNASATVAGQPSSANEIGVAHDYYAGPGSTAIIPIVINLRPSVTLRTILFSVDVTPVAPNTNLISTEMEGRRPAVTDFIRVLRPVVNDTGDYLMGTNCMVQSGSTRLLVSVTGTNAGFVVQNHAVAALVCVPMPVAPVGSTWRVGLSRVSATTDGKTDLPLTVMSARNLVVSNVSYVVGDISPAAWYSGRDSFGDGELKGSDINVIYAAAAGVNLPFGNLVNSASPDGRKKYCDLLDAMDVFPMPYGDGKFSYLDSQNLLNQYWGFDTNIWVRTWSSTGKRVTTKLGADTHLALRAQSATLESAAPATDGTVWVSQARISSTSLENVAPGQICSFPVYVDVAPQCSVAGLQLRAVVDAEGAAPAVGAVDFWPDTAASPVALGGAGPNDIIRVYPLVPTPSFAPPLTGRTHIGDVMFQVPANAQPKQAYTLRFVNTDGAPDLQTAYQFESLSATAWVSAPAQRPAQQLPDEWKLAFFGSTSVDLADASADPDRDGLNNLQEYLAGTNPTNAQSRVQFLGSILDATGKAVALSWLTAPGKSYSIEWIDSLTGTNWTAVATVIGDGAVHQFTDGNAGAKARYYRLRVQAP